MLIKLPGLKDWFMLNGVPVHAPAARAARDLTKVRNMVYTTRFKVRGRFEFPLDMLRYDGCYPATQLDVFKICRKTGPHRHESENALFEPEIELIHKNPFAGWRPTEGRWSSFNWDVVPNSIKVEKS